MLWAQSTTKDYIRTDQSEGTEGWDSHKLQVPGLIYNWWGFQAWDTLQDTTGNSSIDKVEMTGVFLSVPRYDLCAHLSHPSSCMHVNHGPSQQSSKEEYKPWKWGATARILHILYKDHVAEPRSSRQLDHTKTSWPLWRDANCSGTIDHVSRSSGLAKTVLQGTVKGGRRQGRQRKRWEDNIREWTGLEFAKSQRAVENRENWRELVVKSCVVPQRPSRLRDRWGERKDFTIFCRL